MSGTFLPGDADLHQQSVSTDAARLLANTTKSAPQYIGSGPRWLVALLPWLALEAGTFRINRLRVVAPPPRLVDVENAGADSSVTAGSLRAVSALRELPDDLLIAVAGALTVEQHPAGESVALAGDEPPAAWMRAAAQPRPRDWSWSSDPSMLPAHERRHGSPIPALCPGDLRGLG